MTKFKYTITESRFVPFHHPASPAVYGANPEQCCSHHTHTVATIHTALPIVQLRCALPQCDGVLGVCMALHEPALRLCLERNQLRCVPFNFRSCAQFTVEREMSTRFFRQQELAHHLMPLQLVYTPLLWMLLASPVSANDMDDDDDCIDDAAVAKSEAAAPPDPTVAAQPQQAAADGKDTAVTPDPTVAAQPQQAAADGKDTAVTPEQEAANAKKAADAAAKAKQKQEERERRFEEQRWLDGVVSSEFLFEQYRLIIYSLMRAAENSCEDAATQAELVLQRETKQTPHTTLSAKRQRSAALRAAQAQRFLDGTERLFKKYMDLLRMRLLESRREIMELGSDDDANDYDKELAVALNRLTVRILNVLELHIMDLISVPEALRTRLQTPLMQVQCTTPSYTNLMDADAISICHTAVHVRSEIARGTAMEQRLHTLTEQLTAPGVAVAEAEEDAVAAEFKTLLDQHAKAELYEDMFPSFISDATLLGITGARQYNTKVLTAIMRRPDETGAEPAAATTDSTALPTDEN